VVLHIAGAFDTSVDTTNGSGVTGYLGLLDPIMEPPTPTPTMIPTSTMTPVVPTLTPTSCLDTLTEADFNLDGINSIDSRDLLLLYASLKSGDSDLYDLDCSGTTDVFHLIQFSQWWQMEIP